MTVLRDALDRPIPPTDIVARLKRVDDRLDLMYVKHIHRDYANTNLQEYWAIIQRWSEQDPRQRMIQLGTMNPGDDYDLLIELPLDCPVEEAFGFFERAVRGMVRDKKDVERLVSRLRLWNEDVVKEGMKETRELGEELVEANAGTLFRDQGKTMPKIFQGGKR